MASKNKKHKKPLTKAQKKKRTRRTLLIVEVVVLLLLVAFLYAWLKLGLIDFKKVDNVKKNNLKEETEEQLKGYTTLAFFGVDNRSNGNYESGMSDVIMVCAINNEKNAEGKREVRLMSVYRDTAMDVDGEGNIQKANYAFNHGGVENSINMLNRNLDLDIQDFVIVDFKAVTDAVNAVGGVEIELTQEEADYTNTYIAEVAAVTGEEGQYVSAGLQNLSGVQATAYCRVRYTAGGDLKRAERQRTVLMKLAEKAQNASIGELNNLITAIFPEISTSLDLTEILSLAKDAKSYILAGTAGYPFSMTTGSFGSAGSLDIPCTVTANVTAAQYYLYGNDDYTPSETVSQINDLIYSIGGYTEEDALDYGFGTLETLVNQWRAERGDEPIVTENTDGTTEDTTDGYTDGTYDDGTGGTGY